MATKFTISIPQSTPRNPGALAAMQRKGGAMKHKNTAKGGQRNAQRDLLDEWYEDTADANDIQVDEVL